MDYSLPGSSVHKILQARILEWVAMPSSWRSSRPRDQDCIVSCIGRSGSSPLEPPGKLCALCPRPSFLGPAYRCPSSSLVQMGTSLWGEQRLSPLAGSSQDLELENTMIVFALPETFPSQTFPMASPPTSLLGLSPCSQQQTLPWDCSPISMFQLPTAALPRGLVPSPEYIGLQQGLSV